MSRFRLVLLLGIWFGRGIGFAAEAAASEAADLFITERAGSGVRCRMGGVEHAALAAPVPEAVLRSTAAPSASARQRSAVGLNLLLRGTPQLEGFPAARAAFERAAERWERIINTPITVVIDVDFGPTRFGTPFPNADTIGATNTDLRTFPYPGVRTALIASLPGSVIYNALPVGSVPTDIGPVTDVVAPSTTFRVLGLLPPDAPDSGPAPSIGFNSAFSFDFDPSDGIDAGTTDFDAAAVHEFGHVLGFNSRVGQQEVAPGSPTSVSVWDLFRFRPGVTISTFGTELRVQIPGGEQLFFEGTGTLPLSTAAPNGAGGDGRSASHWKDDALSLFYIGIMDPTLLEEERKAVSYFDLVALFWMGYAIGPAALPPTVFSLEPATAQSSTAPLTVSVFGADFTFGANALWRGALREVQVVSSGEVRVQLLAGDLRDVGVASIEILNPGSIPSQTLYFTVTPGPGGGPCERGAECDPRRPRLLGPRS
ncbi:MAG TPA: NF038122 family metalloprotease [Thermoanaerobaculia bacterium]